MLGLNCGGFFSKATRINPGVFEVLMEFLNSCDNTEKFEVSSIQVNYNFQSQVHRDKANAGMSAMIAFGQFTGGRLLYWHEDDGSPDFYLNNEPLYLHSKQLRFFDGRKYHGTEPFEGNRYTIIYFKVRDAEGATPKVQDELIQMGARVHAWMRASV